MKLKYLVDSDNFSAESDKLKERMKIFNSYYLMFPDNVSIIVRQGAVEDIVSIYPESKYFEIKELHPKKKERGGLDSLSIGKSAVITIGKIQYQIQFKNENPSQ